jgi:arylsulfatase A-like enzyme
MSTERHLHLGTALIVLLALALLSGCRTAPPVPAPTGHIDLLQLCPPTLDAAGRQFPPAQRRVFEFGPGLPDGMTAGPAGVRVTRVAGGLLLEADQPPWIEFRETADPLRYQMLRTLLGPSDGEKAELFFAFEDPPQFSLGNRVARRLKPDEESFTCDFQLPHPDAVRVPLQVFRFYPGGYGSTRGVIRRLELVPHGPSYLAQNILSRERVDLGQDYRHCWRYCVPGERKVQFRVPDGNAELYFSSGTLVGNTPGRLRILLAEAGGEETELWRGRFGPAGQPWADHRLDLGRWAGKTVSLRFVVRTQKPGIYLVGNPVVRHEERGDKPGVLLVLIDTVRADRTSLHGHRQRTTPHLDRLSRHGVLFSRVSAPSSWTLPSTAALLTGRYPDELGVRETGGPAVPETIPTLAERLSTAGFTCGAFVANFGLSPFRSFARGFDAYYVAPYSEKMMRADQLNELALEWVAEHRDERLFCYVHYMDPHAPYDAPTTANPLRGADREFNIGQRHQWRTGDIVPLLMGWQQVRDPRDIDILRDYYDEEIAWVDQQLGSLLARLEALGILEKMVVLVTSDHGEEFFDHGNWSHGLTLFEEMLHVPMVLVAPDLARMAGTVVDRPVTLIDVAPTIEELCGLAPANGDYAGRDLFDAPPDRVLFSQTRAGQAPPRFGVVQGRYKYAWFDRAAGEQNPPTSIVGRWLMANGPPAEILFDLWQDPLEQENIIEGQPEVADRLRREMYRRFEKIDGSAGSTGTEDEVDADTAARLRALGYME